MLERLEVQDYQSLKDVDLTLGRFTVIVGPSGAGKSSLIRALRAACFNQVGGRFIRHGRPKAWVRLTFDGDQAVEWEKPREKGAAYAFDGTEYTRVGRAVPEEIESALRIRRIEVDKGFSFAPQFQTQHDLPLLLTESSTLAARALAKLTKLQIIVDGQMDCRRDQRRAEKSKEAAGEEAARAKERLGGLPNVRRARNVMERAQKLLAAIRRELARITEADSIAQDIAGTLLLADVVPPSPEHIASLEASMARLEQGIRAIVASEGCEESLEAARSEVEEAEVALTGVEDSYQALVDELGACPLCGSTETWGKHSHEVPG